MPTGRRWVLASEEALGSNLGLGSALEWVLEKGLEWAAVTASPTEPG